MPTMRTAASGPCSRPISPVRNPGFTIDEIEPRLFSFNNPFGACPACDGLGVSSHFDEQLVVPDHRQTLRGGAIAPWANSSSRYYIQTLESLADSSAFLSTCRSASSMTSSSR